MRNDLLMAACRDLLVGTRGAWLVAKTYNPYCHTETHAKAMIFPVIKALYLRCMSTLTLNPKPLNPKPLNPEP